MRRDMDLIRRLLIETETLGYDGDMNSRVYGSSWFEDVEDDAFYYHVRLLDEAGYLTSFSSPTSFGDNVEKHFPFSLTWEGHEFLDSIRDKSSWEKLKKSLGKNLSTIPVSALAAVTSEMAKEWALQKMGLK
ncbi:hypothetical protein C5G87_17125 [Paenibacillus peoriae]|uniref:DUF2513 domain-containing protein n=1 Tax=Paenibacillus peoriae TaxID=59893 RepID=UPI000CEBA82A|nr:DUF2513 domain-containing protein [Paenibacillus peoriae]PPQ47836.1 hypothetical protein C5G87_17125 [Paenibacillus peoriae]